MVAKRIISCRLANTYPSEKYYMLIITQKIKLAGAYVATDSPKIASNSIELKLI